VIIMGPTKFSDIAKTPTDILNEDYTSKISLKCKKSAGPVKVTLETKRGPQGVLSSKVGTKFAYAGLSFDKVQLLADGGQVFESSLTPYSGVKLSFKGNKGADLGCDYKSGNFFATGKLDVKDMSQFSTSGCYGMSSGISVGGNATYNMSGKSGISAFNIGTSYSSGPFFASVTSSNKVSQFNLSTMYKVNANLTLASSTTHSSTKSFDLVSVGGLYKAPFGDVKAKVGSDGLVSACIIKKVASDVTVTASGSVAASDPSAFKYGLGIVM